jgi:hypothetical protein
MSTGTSTANILATFQCNQGTDNVGCTVPNAEGASSASSKLNNGGIKCWDVTWNLSGADSTYIPNDYTDGYKIQSLMGTGLSGGFT